MFNSVSGFKSGVSSYSLGKRQSPEEMIKKYMKEHNCSEAEAKAALESMYGKPQQQEPNKTNANDGNTLESFKKEVNFANFNRQYNNFDDINAMKNKKSEENQNIGTSKNNETIMSQFMKDTGLADKTFKLSHNNPDTGYKNSSKDNYISKLLEKGFSESAINAFITNNDDSQINEEAKKKGISVPKK